MQRRKRLYPVYLFLIAAVLFNNKLACEARQRLFNNKLTCEARRRLFNNKLACEAWQRLFDDCNQNVTSFVYDVFDSQAAGGTYPRAVYLENGLSVCRFANHGNRGNQIAWKFCGQ